MKHVDSTQHKNKKRCWFSEMYCLIILLFLGISIGIGNYLAGQLYEDKNKKVGLCVNESTDR